MKWLQCHRHQTTIIWVVWLCPIQYIYMLTWSCSWMLAHVLLGTCRECSEEDKTEEGLVYATPPNTQTVCDSASYTTLCPYTPATTCAPIKCTPWRRKKTTYYYTCSRWAHPTHTHKQKFWYHCRFMVLVRCSNMECEHIRKMQMKKKRRGKPVSTSEMCMGATVEKRTTTDNMHNTAWSPPAIPRTVCWTLPSTAAEYTFENREDVSFIKSQQLPTPVTQNFRVSCTCRLRALENAMG